MYICVWICLSACSLGWGGGGLCMLCVSEGRGRGVCLVFVYIMCVCVCCLGGRRCMVYILLSIHHCVFVFSVDLLLLLFFLASYSVLSDVSVACADPGMHHEDKKKIKQLIYHQVRDFLFYPRAELSDDEDGESFFRLLAASRCVSCVCVS